MTRDGRVKPSILGDAMMANGPVARNFKSPDWTADEWNDLLRELTELRQRDFDRDATPLFVRNRVSTVEEHNRLIRKELDALVEMQRNRIVVSEARRSAIVSDPAQRCPDCAPGYDCERGIYTPSAGDAP